MAPSHQHSSEQALRIAFLYWIHFRLTAKTVWNWLCHFILDIFRNGVLTLSTFCTQFRGWDCSDFNPWLIFTFPVLVMVSCVNIFVFSLLLSENLLFNCFLGTSWTCVLLVSNNYSFCNRNKSERVICVIGDLQ